ncbi:MULTISPECIES: morphogenic membrane protein MmpB [Streptomyces]
MLWSDPSNEPPEELREAQAMLRRAGLVIAIGMIAAFILLGLH